MKLINSITRRRLTALALVAGLAVSGAALAAPAASGATPPPQ